MNLLKSHIDVEAKLSWQWKNAFVMVIKYVNVILMLKVCNDIQLFYISNLLFLLINVLIFLFKVDNLDLGKCYG